MRDDNLYQLMLHDATHAPTVSASDDLRRGRRRLRRRRAGVAVATAVFGVLAASVTAYGVNGTTGTSGAPATHQTDHEDPPTGFLADGTWPPARRAYERLRAVVFDHTAYADHAAVPRGKAWAEAGVGHMGDHDDGFAYHDGGGADESWVLNVQWERPWVEDSSRGLLRVEVYGREDAEDWGSDWMTRCGTGLWTHRFPTCEERTTQDGETVLVGIDQRPDGLWLRVSWKQPDGTLVGAGFYGPKWREADGPSLTVEDLIDVATDPRLNNELFEHD